MAWRVLSVLALGVALMGCRLDADAGPAQGEGQLTARRAAAPEPEPREGDGLRPQPKPGERVRQPELDGYCLGESGGVRNVAFYYHGGMPVRRLARRDGCSPLYLSECERDGHCYPPRDQEPGMWCCAPAVEQAPLQQAAR
ncbi:MAG: hypothetical protein PVI30_11130 [Myxococcales bacterium]|jgi:hypothetical protein